VWLTETSAFARRTNDSGVLTWGSNDPVQAGLYQERRVKWLLDELMTGTQRIERLYYYFVRSPGEDLRTADAWDSGLAQPNGTKRPSWGLFCRRAGGFISGNCVY
jgi:hypothetical protein